MSTPRPRSRSPHDFDELGYLGFGCIREIFTSLKERVYLKDRESRFLLVSEGWMAAYAPGLDVEQVIGKTDGDFFAREHAAATLADEEQVVQTGEPIIEKLERELFVDRIGGWVSTTRMPLRGVSGHTFGTFGIIEDLTAPITIAYPLLNDPVTGLVNRSIVIDRLSQGLLALQRHPARLAVLLVNLDDLGKVNAAYGHRAGDKLLAECGQRLLHVARRGDTVGRLEGDELVVLCARLSDDVDLKRIGTRILQSIGASYLQDGSELLPTCCIGVATTRDYLTDPEQLLDQARTTMRMAKAVGPNRCLVHPCH